MDGCNDGPLTRNIDCEGDDGSREGVLFNKLKRVEIVKFDSRKSYISI